MSEGEGNSALELIERIGCAERVSVSALLVVKGVLPDGPEVQCNYNIWRKGKSDDFVSNIRNLIFYVFNNEKNDYSLVFDNPLFAGLFL